LPRHQTLRALFDWSHELLSGAERILFRRLAVFVGAWSLEAAEAVCGNAAIAGAPAVGLSSYTTATISREDVLVLLLGLVDKSLVLVQEREGESRYRLLETLREYAQEKLDESGETRVSRAAHTVYFASLVGGPGPQPVQEVIERVVSLPVGLVAGHADNLRAALGYMFDDGDAEAGLSMVARIYHLWQLRGPREEGQEWLRRFLTMPTSGATPSRPAALFAAGWMATFQGDVEEADAAFAEAASLALARGDLAGCAYARTKLGVVASLQGDTARSRAESEEGARLARGADAPVALLEGLVQLAYLALSRGDLEDVREALSEAWTVLPRFPATAFRIQLVAGDLALAEGEPERAASAYRAVLSDRWADRDPLGVSVSALGLAEVAAVSLDRACAARLLGASEGLAMVIGDRAIPEPGPVRRAQHARVEAAALVALGAEEFARLRAEGRQLELEEVVRLAFAD
jgi:non-specific serine/threonine protein kinase